MKTQFILKPLAFALAAVLSAGVYAGNNGNNGGNNGGGHGDGGPSQESSSVVNGGNASIVDNQNNHNNVVLNQGTENTAKVEGSLNGASGNVGVNVAAGDNNQQANAGAIATADALWIFGLGTAASANIGVTQTEQGNALNNYSVPNNATLIDSANGATGNMGINVAAGNFNQQKNDMAIGESSTAFAANANVNVDQHSSNNATNNVAQVETVYAPVTLSMNGTGTYKGQSDQIGDVYLDSWTGVAGGRHGVHPGGQPTGHLDVDSAAQGAQDLNDDGGAFAFNEAGTSTLVGSVTGNIPIAVGYRAPVVNNATVTNSLNGGSGNLGVNVAAGGGNQQSNSLAIAAGCTACL